MLKPLREQGDWTLFSGIIFGAHELGHLFWMPFGEWMSVAGGSLTQLLLPIGAAAVAWLLLLASAALTARLCWWMATERKPAAT